MRSRPAPRPRHHGHKHDAAGWNVLITLTLTEGQRQVDVEEGASIRDVLLRADLAPSLHIVDHEGQVLPMSTLLNADVHLTVTRTASGG